MSQLCLAYNQEPMSQLRLAYRKQQHQERHAITQMTVTSMPYNEAFRVMLTARGYSLLGIPWPRPILPGGYPAAYPDYIHLHSQEVKSFSSCLMAVCGSVHGSMQCLRVSQVCPVLQAVVWYYAKWVFHYCRLRLAHCASVAWMLGICCCLMLGIRAWPGMMKKKMHGGCISNYRKMIQCRRTIHICTALVAIATQRGTTHQPSSCMYIRIIQCMSA